MRAAMEVGATSGRFRVPRVETACELDRVFELEWIQSYRPLGELETRELTDRSLLTRIGEALATIHASTWDATPTDRRALFHGDPDPFNVGVDGEGQVVFLDWDPAPGIEKGVLSEQQLDVGLLYFYLSCLLVRRRVSTQRSHGCLLALEEGYRTGRFPSPHAVSTWGSGVGQVLSTWRSVPGSPVWRRLYRWYIRRAGLARIMKAQGSTTT